MKTIGQQSTEQWKQMCKQYHHYMVQVASSDGSVHEGILDGYDQDRLYLLVPAGDDDADMRQYGAYGYGWGYPWGYPFWGYPYWGYPRRFRRFRRFGFPFFGLRGLYFPFFF